MMAEPLALLAGVVAGVVAAVVDRRLPPDGPVYTVAQVQADLARQPTSWAGRTLLVRGIAVESFWATGPTTAVGHLCYLPSSSSPGPCPLIAPNGATVYLALLDDSVMHPPAKTTALLLAVQPVTPNPLIALARRLPSLAPFLSAHRQVPGSVPHLYRIRLRSARSTPCAGLWFTCAPGILVNIQP